MVVSGSFAGCTWKAWCSFAGRTMVALCSLVGSTMVALCSFVGSTGVALCSFGGSTVVAPVGRAVLPVPLAGRENAGRAWLGCPQALGHGHRWGVVPLCSTLVLHVPPTPIWGCLVHYWLGLPIGRALPML
ncbi:hypothetical protein V6N11_002275 [Hibiscus sabdariffa]|uniref:Uncharacterized protein n=1 Tax=Hibiscus sabdariffa TaxID=183260 RepID=A0ABR2QVC4_9ROSI